MTEEFRRKTMTREEAIEFGKMWLEVNEDSKGAITYEFFKMALKALEQEPCEDAVNDVLETIHEEIQKEKEGITFNLNEEKARWTNGGIYDGLTWAQEIIDKYKDKEGE